jgi:hypothetical protein
MRLEILAENPAAAARLQLRGAGQCPGVKSLWLDALRAPLLYHGPVSLFRDMVELLEEKEIRLCVEVPRAGNVGFGEGGHGHGEGSQGHSDGQGVLQFLDLGQGVAVPGRGGKEVAAAGGLGQGVVDAGARAASVQRTSRPSGLVELGQFSVTQNALRDQLSVDHNQLSVEHGSLSVERAPPNQQAAARSRRRRQSEPGQRFSSSSSSSGSTSASSSSYSSDSSDAD